MPENKIITVGPEARGAALQCAALAARCAVAKLLLWPFPHAEVDMSLLDTAQLSIIIQEAIDDGSKKAVRAALDDALNSGDGNYRP